MQNVVERAGLVPRGTDVWGTSPTRSHEVLVMCEGGRWVAWAGRYHNSYNRGRTPMREWVLYTGPHVRRSVEAATRFAGRLARR